jgi:hypothetical protein
LFFRYLGTPLAAQQRCGNNPITSNLYDAAQEGEVPETAIRASLGCGNLTALAELKSGEIVRDLGSGGGIDVLLSVRRMGSWEAEESTDSAPPARARRSMHNRTEFHRSGNIATATRAGALISRFLRNRRYGYRSCDFSDYFD